MTQRLLALTVAGVLALSLAACSADASSPSAAPGQSTASPAPSASPSAPAPSFPDGVTNIECDVSAQTRPGAIQVLGDGKTLAVVLAKKVYDWDRQHANGMEAVISSDGLTFGDIEEIVLVLRHTLGDAFDGQAKPETFKEMALHIALIEIGRAS